MIIRFTQFFFVLFCGCFLQTSAQNAKIKGKVTDEKGSPLFGVTINAIGSQIGVTSDKEGNYNIVVPPNVTALSYSFLGMETRNVNIRERTVINVRLKSQDIKLDEVTIVVGYGTAKKKDLTGAVSSVDSKELQGQIMNTIEQGLQGRVSGVNINQSDGSPGGGLNVTIRGSNSLIGGTEPLYVVDGFPIDGQSTEVKDGISQGNPPQNKLNFLNPADIESIQILKDASATAIYGSRGANGVVLITTKSGQNQNAEFSINQTLELGNMLKAPKSMSAYDFTWLANTRRLVNDVFYGDIPYETAIKNIPYKTTWASNGSLTKGSPEDYANGLLASTNWMDVITRTGVSQRTLLSARGGTRDFKYYFSGGYDNVEGIILATDFKRYSFNSNININLSKNISLVNTFNLSVTSGRVGQSGLLNGEQKSLLMQSTIGTSPLNLLQDEFWEEEFGVITGSDNPYVQATRFKELNTNKSLLERLALNFTILPSLAFNVSGGVNYRENTKDMYYPKSTLRGDRTGGGRAFYGTNANYRLLNDYMLTYKTKIKKHNINITGVYSLEYFKQKVFTSAVSGFLNDVLENYSFNSATDFYKPSSGTLSTLGSSGIARLNYNYNNRYLLTATIRADGNSKFGESNKWGYFPSLAVAWRVVQEDFFKRASAFSDFKIRASYGVTGNAGLAPYQSLPLMDVTMVAFQDEPYLGIYNGNIPNPQLRWEKTYQANIGADIGLFKDRLYVTADVYDKTTHGLLQRVRLASSTGFSSRVMNLGSLQNRGIEVLVKGSIIKSKKLNWDLSANWSSNKSKILDLGGMKSYREGVMIDNWYPFVIEKGAQLGLIYGYKVSNIIKTEEDIANAALDNPNKRIGEYDYVKDANGMMKEMVIGNTNPDFIYGFSTMLNFKNFTVNANFAGSVGNDVLNVQKQIVQNRSLTLPSELYNYWIPEIRNSEGEVVIPDNGKNGLSIGYPNNTVHDISKLVDRYIEDGSFFRMNSLSVSYRWIPNHRVKFFRSITPTFSVSNLFMITNYSGVNPETSVYGQDPIRRGVAYYEYPLPKSFSFGLNCVFK